MLFNPPYGERLEIKGRGARDALPKNNNSPEFMEFLNQFGRHLKDNFQGWQVDVLTADMGLPGQLRMKESKRTPLFNGPLECRLFRFEMKKPDGMK
jgi:putative N6-adenine-specific DNA methylase